MDRIEIMLEPVQVFLHQAADFLPRLGLALLILVAGYFVATRVLELGGEGRAAAAREARDVVLETTSRRAWAAAWDHAVRRAAARAARTRVSTSVRASIAIP